MRFVTDDGVAFLERAKWITCMRVPDEKRPGEVACTPRTVA